MSTQSLTDDPLGPALARSPALWMLVVIPGSIALPGLNLRRGRVRPESGRACPSSWRDGCRSGCCGRRRSPSRPLAGTSSTPSSLRTPRPSSGTFALRGSRNLANMTGLSAVPRERCRGRGRHLQQESHAAAGLSPREPRCSRIRPSLRLLSRGPRPSPKEERLVDLGATVGPCSGT